MSRAADSPRPADSQSPIASAAAPVAAGSTRCSLWGAFLIVLLLSLLIRLPWAWYAHVTPIGDHYGYDATAWHWAQTGEYRLLGATWRAYRPPGYTALVALVYWMCGQDYRAVALVQAVLGALTSALLVILAGRTVTPRVGLIAGLLHTFWPTALAYTPVVASDNLAIFLLVAGLTALVGAHRASRWRGGLCTVLSGLAYGWMFLTRPVSLFFLPAWLLLSLYDPHGRRWRPRTLLLTLACMVIVMAPWFIRNYWLGFGLTTISTQGGRALWWGNNWRSVDGGNPAPPSFDETAGMGEIEQHRFFQHQAVEWITHNPRRYFALSGIRFLRYFSSQPDVWAAKYFIPTEENDKAVRSNYWSTGRWPERADSPEYAQRGAALESRHRNWDTRFRVIAAPLMLLSLLLALRRPRTFAFALLPFACYLAGLSLTVFAARYRTSGDPLVFITLAALLTDLFSRRSQTLGRWGGRRIKWALAASVVAASIAVYYNGWDRSWYTLPPGAEPNPAVRAVNEHWLTLDLASVDHVHTVGTRTCSAALALAGGDLDVALSAAAKAKGNPYGGIQVAVPGLAALRIDVAWHQPENIAAIFVIGRGPHPRDPNHPRTDVVRWEWRPTHPTLVPPADVVQSYILAPNHHAAHFVPRSLPGIGQLRGDETDRPAWASIDDLRVLVRIKPGTSGGFTLHRLDVLVPASVTPFALFGQATPLTLPDASRVQTSASPAATADLATTGADLRFTVRGSSGSATPTIGGLTLPISPPAAAAAITLAFVEPEHIDECTVVARDVTGEVVARWSWPVSTGDWRPLRDEPGTYLFVPQEPCPPFVIVSDAGAESAAESAETATSAPSEVPNVSPNSAPIATIEVTLRVAPQSSAGLAISGLARYAPRTAAPPTASSVPTAPADDLAAPLDDKGP